MVRTDNPEEVGLHVFEKAGLGKAPFRCVGVTEKVGPITMPDGTQIGSPGQPMGCCDYCGTGIKDCYVIQSSDKKQFVVGCDCVARTGDAGLIKSYKNLPEVRAFNKAKRDALNDRKRNELATIMAERAEDLKAILLPPNYKGVIESQYDYLVRVIPMCGAAGRASYLKLIKKLLEI